MKPLLLHSLNFFGFIALACCLVLFECCGFGTFSSDDRFLRGFERFYGCWSEGESRKEFLSRRVFCRR